MQVTTEAVVLRVSPISEADLVLVLLSRDYGIITAFANGARRIGSKLAAGVGQFCYSAFSLFKRRGTYSVNTADLSSSFYFIREDVEKLALASYFAQLTIALNPDTDNAAGFLRLLLNTLYLLEKANKPIMQLKAVFELRALSKSGYMPRIVCCEGCGVYESKIMHFAENGDGIICEKCTALLNKSKRYAQISDGVLAAMRHIVYSDMEVLYNFELSGECLPVLSKVCEGYAMFGAEQSFKALEFFRRVANI